MPASESDRELVGRIRSGEEQAWRECIAEYEGRLLAFVDSRLRDRALSEDVVQETFLGFLTALPNFDENTPIEAFLFAIAAHKLTDQLRKRGRRPTLPLLAGDSSNPMPEPDGRDRAASSIARSREGRSAEERRIADCLAELIRQWFERREFERLMCAELLFVKGLPNKEVAHVLNITEQAVANHKHFIVSKLKQAAPASGESFSH
jgi:RNA polymerase sigma-70 factor, ECF subfamily